MECNIIESEGFDNKVGRFLKLKSAKTLLTTTIKSYIIEGEIRNQLNDTYVYLYCSVSFQLEGNGA